jgi:hypothetical protein
MTNKFLTTAILFFVCSNQVHANVLEFIPKGYSLALQYTNEPAYQGENNPNYGVYDYNQDGFPDYVLLVEKLRCSNYLNDGTCDPTSVFGSENRKLIIYMSNSKGEYNLFLETKNVVLNYGDAGQTLKEPLSYFELGEEGVISLSYAGGDFLRWSYDIQIGYRTDIGTEPDFYIEAIMTVGDEWYSMPNGTPNDFITLMRDRNFRQGKVERSSWVTSQKFFDDTFVSDIQDLELNQPILLRSVEADFVFATPELDRFPRIKQTL